MLGRGKLTSPDAGGRSIDTDPRASRDSTQPSASGTVASPNISETGHPPRHTVAQLGETEQPIAQKP